MALSHQGHLEIEECLVSKFLPGRPLEFVEVGVEGMGVRFVGDLALALSFPIERGTAHTRTAARGE